jgi:hypothetical protein
MTNDAIGLGDLQSLLPFGVAPMWIAQKNSMVGSAGSNEMGKEHQWVGFCQQESERAIDTDSLLTPDALLLEACFGLGGKPLGV